MGGYGSHAVILGLSTSSACPRTSKIDAATIFDVTIFFAIALRFTKYAPEVA